ncbi:hypothetical protein TNCV_431601 [Trichonephila clavipes]|nr:hypothetical protein TNCV_431601 [Trichonephila clavipes]
MLKRPPIGVEVRKGDVENWRGVPAHVLSWLLDHDSKLRAVALGTIQVTVRFGSIPPQFGGRTLCVWSEASHLSSPSTNLMRGLTPRWVFRVSSCRAQATVSSAAIQEHVAPSLGAPASYRTIRRRLAEGHLGSRHLLRVLPLTPTHGRLGLEGCHARVKLDCSGMEPARL